jgi:hypothetical protein
MFATPRAKGERKRKREGDRERGSYGVEVGLGLRLYDAVEEVVQEEFRERRQSQHHADLYARHDQVI